MTNCPKCKMPLSEIGDHILKTPFGDLHGMPCGLVHSKTFQAALWAGVVGTKKEKFFADYFANRKPWPDPIAERQDAGIKEALEIINE